MKLNLSFFALAVLLTSCSSNPSRGPADTSSAGSTDSTDSTDQTGTDGTDATDGATDATDGATDTTDGGTDATDGGTDATTSTDGTDGTEATDPPPPAGIPLLGNGKNSINYVKVAVVGSEEIGQLATPKDLAVNPYRPNELWVVNQANNSVSVIIDYADAQKRTGTRYSSFGSQHFCAKPAGIAFGTDGHMATAQEEDQLTQGPNGTPPDFMGPTLWPTNLAMFDAGHASHMDMLHNSPNSTGIAWEAGNTYWVFDGYHSSLTRYAFNGDHGPGGADHSDGVITRYAEGLVKRVPKVASNLQYDAQTKLLYVADTGNSRVAVLDTASGAMGGATFPNYDGCIQNKVNTASVTTLIDGDEFGLQSPSGLVKRGDLLLVGDNATGYIHAFTTDGEQLDWMDAKVGPDTLNGIEMAPAGNLLITDTAKNSIYMISPLDE